MFWAYSRFVFTQGSTVLSKVGNIFEAIEFYFSHNLIILLVEAIPKSNFKSVNLFILSATPTLFSSQENSTELIFSSD